MEEILQLHDRLMIERIDASTKDLAEIRKSVTAKAVDAIFEISASGAKAEETVLESSNQ